MSAREKLAVLSVTISFVFAAQLAYANNPAAPALTKRATAKSGTSPKQSAAAPKQSAAELAEDKAIALAEKVKEVRKWEKEFGPTGVSPATNGKPGFDVESHHGSIYVVHVFEDKPEQALTFARYEVNIKTGRVKKVD